MQPLSFEGERRRGPPSCRRFAFSSRRSALLAAARRSIKKKISFDGYRILTRAEGGKVRLITRNGNDWTRRMPELARALESMELPDGDANRPALGAAMKKLGFERA